MAKLLNHLHHFTTAAQAGRALNVGQNLRVVGRIGDPAHLGSLHGKPQPNPLQIVAPGLAVIGEPILKSPGANSFDAGWG